MVKMVALKIIKIFDLVKLCKTFKDLNRKGLHYKQTEENIFEKIMNYSKVIKELVDGHCWCNPLYTMLK